AAGRGCRGRSYGGSGRVGRTIGTDPQGLQPRDLRPWRAPRRRMGANAKARTLRYAGRPGAEMKGLYAPTRGTHPLVFIALGANLGNARKNVLRALKRLRALSDAPLLRSSLWETLPVDCPPNSPPFINAVVGLKPRAGETPESLLA